MCAVETLTHALPAQQADPLLRASRSAAALPPHRSALSLAPVPSSSSPTNAGGRPTTPGGSARAMRNRLEAARLTDQVRCRRTALAPRATVACC